MRLPTENIHEAAHQLPEVDLAKSAIRLIFPLVFLSLVIVGCSLNSSEPNQTAAPSLTFEGLGAVPFEHFVAEFTLTFDGDPPWNYQLTTRRSGDTLERQLRIDGVEDTRNPGEVRMETEGGITRMRGAGTEDRCLQFPEDMGINVTLLEPDDILPPEDFIESFVLLGEEKVGGFNSAHYVLQQAELDGWQQVQVGIWSSAVGGTIIQYELEALGWDPYFGAGWGQLNGRFRLLEVGQQSIEPIKGCRVELPLPAEVQDVVVLPDVIAYGSPLSVDELAIFYRDKLGQTGWRPLEQEERSSGAIVLGFLREGERLKVTIRGFNGITQVELLEED